MARVAEIGKENNLKFIKIHVVNHRSDLIPMYQKWGFTIVGEETFPDHERVTRPCFMYIMKTNIE